MGSSTITDFSEDTKAIDDKERLRLTRKLDLRIMPLVMLYYILSFLDRSNIGNAKIAGLTEDIGMSESDYNNSLSMFFVGYILAEIPSSMILNKLGPKIWISILMVLWGALSALMAVAKNGASLIAIRFFLGVCESGFVPAVLVYLSVWYTKAEISKRIAVFLASTTIAGAIGGLLAYGIMHMDGYRGLHGWQWLFILEAIPTILLGMINYFILPDTPEKTNFLTDREREIFAHRMKTEAIGQKNDIEDDISQRPSWTPVILTLKDWKTYIYGVQGLCLMTIVYCVSLFLPSIIRDLGYTNTLVAQLMTVPPNAVASVLSILNGVSSDCFLERGFHLAIPAALGAVGYALLIGLDEQNVTGHYIAVIVCVSGATACLTPHTAGFLVNFAGKSKRAVASSTITGFATIGGIIAGQIYRATDAPRYIHGHTASLVLISSAVITALTIKVILLRINSQRKKLTIEKRHAILADKNAGGLGDKHPDFRYIT